jgi:hypothetical protein
MKSLFLSAAAALLLANPAWAHDDHDHRDATHSHSKPAVVGAPAVKLDAHTQEDIERHRGMARAHEQAAQCLAAGKPYEDCQKQLQTSCKGLALGKSCGMRHAH